jgi:hypothetical protein
MSTATATATKHKAHFTSDENPASKTEAAIEFAHQAERLGQYAPDQETDATGSTQAVEARFITAQDPVIVTADGGRLPAVPIEEATKLNRLRNVVESRNSFPDAPVEPKTRIAKDGTVHGLLTQEEEQKGANVRAPNADEKAALLVVPHNFSRSVVLVSTGHYPWSSFHFDTRLDTNFWAVDHFPEPR